MNLVILYGGNSGESKVSFSSAKEIKRNLEQNGHLTVLIDLLRDYSDYKNITSYRQLYQVLGESIPDDVIEYSIEDIGNGVIQLCRLVDIVFLSTHGGIGENGQLQAILESEKINFTGNRFLSTAVSMNKDISKRLVNSYGIATPKQFNKCSSIKSDDFPLII